MIIQPEPEEVISIPHYFETSSRSQKMLTKPVVLASMAYSHLGYLFSRDMYTCFCAKLKKH